jgi:hypothetical protein
MIYDGNHQSKDGCPCTPHDYLYHKKKLVFLEGNTKQVEI